MGCLRVSEIVETRHACVGIKNDFLLYNPATVSELLEIVDHCRNHSKTFCFTFFVVVCVFDVLPYYECSNILAWEYSIVIEEWTRWMKSYCL